MKKAESNKAPCNDKRADEETCQFPNIVYIHSHDTGRHIRPYGYAYDTPNLQRFAEQGVLFRNAFAAAPNCSPSRAALLTGEYPHSNGMHGLDHRGGFVLNDYGRHLLHTLRRHGYLTVLAGLQHIGKDTDAIGFDRVLGPARGPRASTVVPRTEAFLDNAPTQPFFMDVGFHETHKVRRTYAIDNETVDNRYLRPPSVLPDTPETRQEIAEFAACVRIFDRAVGDILAALDRNGLSDNTLVLITTDHGLPMPAQKITLSDGGTGVLMMMRGAGGFSGGVVVDALVSQVDVFPTICDYLGIAAPEWLQGVSLMPIIDGVRVSVRDEIFTELTYHGAYCPYRAVRTARWKYIKSFGSEPGQRHHGGDPGPSQDLWMAHGGATRFQAEEQLYDLVFDPNEACNLAAHPDYATVVDRLRQRLESWQVETGDPILHGPIPPRSSEGITNIAYGDLSKGAAAT